MNIMYNSNGYVLSIIAAGKILPELADGSVLIPFGSEYRLRLRNKNSRRAAARIWIDGQEITGNSSVLIPANSFIDLERPLDAAVKFRFVSDSSVAAEEAGKDGPDPMKENGVVRVEFTEEKEQTPPPVVQPVHQRKDWYDGHHYGPRPNRHRLTGDPVDQPSYGMNLMADSQANLNSRGIQAKAGGQHTNSTNSTNGQAMTAGGQSMGFSASMFGAQPMGLKWCPSIEVPEKTADLGIDPSGVTVEGGTSYQRFTVVDFVPSDKPATQLKLVLKGAAAEEVVAVKSSLQRTSAETQKRKEMAALKQQLEALGQQIKKLENS